MDMDISIMDNYGFVFGWILSIHNWIFAIPKSMSKVNVIIQQKIAEDNDF